MSEELDRLLDYFDHYGPEDEAGAAVDCKYCDAFPLEWREIRTVPGNRKAWRLFEYDTDVMHICPKLTGPASPDDFDDLTNAPQAKP